MKKLAIVLSFTLGILAILSAAGIAITGIVRGCDTSVEAQANNKIHFKAEATQCK
jgi:hypothetical protein